MLGFATARLANMGTATKLALGFGLVLLLTAVVTIAGLTALQSVNTRFDALKRVSSIKTEVLSIRSIEQQFTESGDANQVKALNDQVATTLANVAELKAQVGEAQQQGLTSVEQALGDYQAAFGRFVQVSDAKTIALDSAYWSVVSASNSLDILQSGLVEDGLYDLKESEGQRGAEMVSQGQQIAQLYSLILSALNEARQRTQQRDEAPATTIQQAQAALDLTNTLMEALDRGMYGSVLTEVAGNIKSFNDRLADYTQALADGARLYAEMNDRAAGALEAADRAYQAQQDAMHDNLVASSRLILLASGLALIVGVIASLLITRLIVRPLREVIKAANQIARGDLSAHIVVNRRDEFGQLMQAMQEMSTSLRGIVGRLQGAVTQIADSAEQVAGVTAQARDGVLRQRVEIDQVATAMNEMSATVHEVARNAEEAAGSARVADRTVGDGHAMVNQSMQRVGQLVESVQQAVRGIDALSDESQRIGTVLDVIKTVAEQTNLLALNAAIEAARAGEQGRGFAVVADEVRSLAQRTQQSTAEIQQLIDALQTSAKASVRQMQQSNELVQLTATDANQTALALNEIAAAVSSIQQMTQQIATAAEEQTAVAEEINRSVINIRDVADLSFTSMEETTHSLEQFRQLSQELQTLAGHFRVGEH
ncbi:HAMP domain-containing methyl-accepting chemotaxis protein [Stutzerimonas stutzeri]|uniref:HAMP domain-containing methyl-accepting chemotaxis protein n=1 Tax=Stutzerimonas stutzeri TaxID=316 RepID=UPI001C2E3699|nr:methyl-accepting chemotaxis protein [Stutzerimonas stutzeri]